MERVIMPELVTPALAEIINSRPEIMEQLFGNKLNEDVVCGKDLEFDSGNMPKELKFLFCNIRINIDGSPKGYSSEASEDEDEAGSSKPCSVDIRLIIERLKSLGQQLDVKNRQVGLLLSDVVAQKEKLLVLETRIKDDKRTLKLVSSDFGNRKLTYKYKMDIKSLLSNLENERHTFADFLRHFEQEKADMDSLEGEVRKMNLILYERLTQR